MKTKVMDAFHLRGLVNRTTEALSYYNPYRSNPYAKIDTSAGSFKSNYYAKLEVVNTLPLNDSIDRA